MIRKKLGRRAKRCAGVFAALGLLFLVAWFAFPFPAACLDQFPASDQVVSRDGRVLRYYASQQGEFRFPVKLEAMSPWLLKATVAIEDRRFRSHPGVDVVAIGRAAFQNLSRGRVHSGASTLTQQLVRIAEQRPRTLWSKAVEAFHALQLETQRSKNDLLEAYLNLAPYGGNLRGVEAASLRYFGKHARSLSLAEASLLAGLPQSPARLRLDRHLDRALLRREQVLDALLRDGLVSQLERDDSARTVVKVGAHPWPLEAPHFSDFARSLAVRRGASVIGSGRKVETSLDAQSQASAERQLDEFFESDQWGRRELSGAVVILEVATSEILALVGSPDYLDASRKGPINEALRARSPGSLLKPFLYALAFEKGIATPDSWVPDSALAYSNYSPENFDGGYLGPLSAARALSLSRNAPAVHLLERVGVSQFLDCLRSVGLSTLFRHARSYGLALAIGACETRLLDVTNAFAALARGGSYRPVCVDRRVPDESVPVLGRGSSRLTLECLSTEEHLRHALPGIAVRWAGAVGYKTGTSNGLRDAWAVAFSRRRVVGVWLGDPTGRPHPDLVGIQSAAAIALRLLVELEASPSPLFAPIAGEIVERPVCSLTGYPASPVCPSVMVGRAPAEATILPRCTVHREARVDIQAGFELCTACQGAREVATRVIVAWPPEAGFISSTPHDPECRVKQGEARPRILSPADGSEYLLRESPAGEQKMFFAAVAHGATRLLHWFVDGTHVAATAPGDKVSWRPTRGRHEVRCIDDCGRGATVTIRVR